MNVEGERTDEVRIRREVRQGCILSFLLFNIYSERIFKEAVEGCEMGIMVNGERLNNIRYADDTVMFADNPRDLQALMDRVIACSQRYGLNINISKTKLMVVSKTERVDCRIEIDQVPIKRVNKYTYLGTTVNESWEHSQEIRSRIGKVRSVFNRMEKVFKSHNLTMNTNMRFLRCYVFSVLFYGLETWTLTEAMCRRLEAFEMWL